MWSVTQFSDPVPLNQLKGRETAFASNIVHASISLSEFFGGSDHHDTFQRIQSEERQARVALADFCSRRLLEQPDAMETKMDGLHMIMEPLGMANTSGARRHKVRKNQTSPPYVLESTNTWCTQSELNIIVRILMRDVNSADEPQGDASMIIDDEKKTDGQRQQQQQQQRASKQQIIGEVTERAVKSILTTIYDTKDMGLMSRAMAHLASVILQQRLRSKLPEMEAVAFIADGAILPRKSGASELPMASPPAVPFKAPAESTMSKEIQIDMGILSKYLPTQLSNSIVDSSTIVSLSGLIVPAGVTLIVGGGYHGKSTLLRAIAAGVYDKVPGDGREYCVAVREAVTVRAEDGRYVNNCNVSAFISNLPTPRGVDKAPDTQHFSSRNASGSTSQASNVVEAIEMGATALLVDEDVSAANFMARDGRMRSLVMDESITPLLYRVNGLYKTHKISSVVVVGGVGDWLDVPHNVILLNRYEASDATKKAQSISYQFSYGHVQYAGRGVVHRLEWDKHGTPIPRRPADSYTSKYNDPNVSVSMLDGGHAVSLHCDVDASRLTREDSMEDEATEEDDDQGCIDASRMEQLLNRQQLYGCGWCVVWLLRAASKHPKLGLPGLLKLLEETLDERGMVDMFRGNDSKGDKLLTESAAFRQLIESVGFAQRPRLFEIGQAFTRLRGIKLEELPVVDDGSEATAEREAERKRQALADLWAARRKKG